MVEVLSDALMDGVEVLVVVHQAGDWSLAGLIEREGVEQAVAEFRLRWDGLAGFGELDFSGDELGQLDGWLGVGVGEGAVDDVRAVGGAKFAVEDVEVIEQFDGIEDCRCIQEGLVWVWGEEAVGDGLRVSHEAVDDLAEFGDLLPMEHPDGLGFAGQGDGLAGGGWEKVVVVLPGETAFFDEVVIRAEGTDYDTRVDGDFVGGFHRVESIIAACVWPVRRG